MRVFLENNKIKVEIDSLGAEVKSVMNKKGNREYMWYGNPKFWGRTSPVLFPFVGSLKDKKYNFEEKEYPMGQHGFARDNEFNLLSQTENEVYFAFKSNEETLKKYPFEFELRIGYCLKDNELEVIWEVINLSIEKMYFSIGAHPAFLCPINGEESKTGYKLFFENLNEVHHHGNDVEKGLALREDFIMPLDNSRVTITDDFFDRCTYMIEGKQTNCVGIEDREGHRIVDVRFDSPLFAIWSPEKKRAPFICIEPWYGRCDAIDFEGNLTQREYTNVLGGKEIFKAGYSIIFY